MRSGPARDRQVDHAADADRPDPADVRVTSTDRRRAVRRPPQPRPVVGVMLDASAQHPGRTGSRRCASRPAPRAARGAGRRDARARRPGRRRRPAGRRLLARHAPAARHRHGAARRPRRAHPRRAGQRHRSRGHPLDAPAPPDFAAGGGTVLLSSHLLGEVAGHRRPARGHRPRPDRRRRRPARCCSPGRARSCAGSTRDALAAALRAPGSTDLTTDGALPIAATPEGRRVAAEPSRCCSSCARAAPAWRTCSSSSPRRPHHATDHDHPDRDRARPMTTTCPPPATDLPAPPPLHFATLLASSCAR